MSKGDADKAQNQIDYQGGTAQNHLDNTRTHLSGQQGNIWDNYNKMGNQNQADYAKGMAGYDNFLSGMPGAGSSAMSGYQNMAGGGNNFSFDPAFRSQLDSAIKGYQGFADTGGFSEQDKSDLRARAIAPTRAVYANAQSNIDRAKSLQGGYSPNYTAATAKMSRDLASGISDTNTNANAALAQMIQSGKLAGMGGVTQATLGGQGAQNNINSLNAQQQLQGLSGMTDIEKMRMSGALSGMQGANSLYGTTPGMTSMYGNQLNNANSDQLQLQGQQNQLGLGLISDQIQKSQIPSNFQQGLGNAAGIANIVGTGAGAFGGFGNTNPQTFSQQNKGY